MAWSQSHLEELESSIASGHVLRRFADGKTIQFQSLSELRKLRDQIRAELASAAGTATRPGPKPVYVRKGV
jgi:hypothetical protein